MADRPHVLLVEENRPADGRHDAADAERCRALGFDDVQRLALAGRRDRGPVEVLVWERFVDGDAADGSNGPGDLLSVRDQRGWGRQRGTYELRIAVLA